MKTCEEITYDCLKAMIIENKLPKGEFLSQRKLAKATGSTIVTLRSSLRLLENDGLLENVPKWGVRIPIENEELIRERYYVRELLEVGAWKLILDRKESQTREMLEDKAKACDAVQLTGPESYREFARVHGDFHASISKCCGNEILGRMLMRLNLRSIMLSNAKYGWEMHKEYLNKNHHHNFVTSVFDSENEAALQAVREHVRRGCEVELVSLARMQDHENVEQNSYGMV
jgi:DNA-binding GntR family transcriptional regulator